MNEFFAGLYELGGALYLGNFSLELYVNKLYVPVGLTLIISVFLSLLVFYYLIDHPRFNKWTHWLLFVGIVSVLNFGVAFFFSYSELSLIYQLQGTQLPYWADFWIFSLINMLYSLLLAVILSYLVRWWSINCSTCPIPN